MVANFTTIPALQFVVILSSNPQAGGSTTGAGACTAGTSVTITASPSIGYQFVNRTERGNIVSTSSAFTFAVYATRTFTANFALITYSLNVIATNGTVAKTPNQAQYNSGAAVQLTETPVPGYTFTSWSGDATGNTNPLTVTMNSDKNITANFSPNGFPLNVTATNGTVAKNPNQSTYISGTTVQLTATPNAGYTFTSWTGDASGAANTLSVTMNANKNITANFTSVATPTILGNAAMFGAFGGNAGITNQGIFTVINGSIGTTAASNLITGFHDRNGTYTETPLNIGNVTGDIYADVPAPGNATKGAIASQALLDANAAYISILPAMKPGGIDPGAGELGGLTLAPGVYKSASGTFKISNGDLTVDAQGDPNAQWIFQTTAGLTVGIAGPVGARSVKLTNGAQSKNVFWYVGTAGNINGAGGGIMTGTIIASAGVTFSTPGNVILTVLNGRAISLVASVTMVNTVINVPNQA